VNTTASNAGQASASGAFDVTLGSADALPTPDDAPALARRGIEKHYRGDLQGRSLGQMLSAGQPQSGEAAYTALESFAGTLNGRRGGFALAHLGTMHGGAHELRIAIVPGSGTGELAGILGEMQVRIEGSQHYYALTYRLG
jgi:hypothetical protein